MPSPSTKRAQATYDKRTSAGLCRCGGAPQPGYKRCDECADSTKKRRLRLISEKKCVACAKTHSGETDRCMECALKYRCRSHGITVDHYQELLAKQNGACPVCQEPLQAKPYIDHDHKTNVVRGLLHNYCNWFLGAIEKRPDDVRRALTYLEGLRC